MIKLGFIILLAVFFTIFLSGIFSKSQDFFFESSVQGAFNKISINISDHNINAEVADTAEKRNAGLSGRKNLSEDAGMLFVFEIPAKYSFWMKDMLYPLDIIWIDENKKIIAISENITPDTYPASFFPSDPVKYALEVNGGWTKNNQIRIGDFIEL